MKTAVSVPNTIFRGAEKLAHRLKKTRSELYSEALKEYLARHEPDDITERMNQVCEVVGTRPDTFLHEAARRILKQVEW